jgi:hypothetical protein
VGLHLAQSFGHLHVILQGHPITKVSNIQVQKYHKKGMKLVIDSQKSMKMCCYFFLERNIKYLSFPLSALERFLKG